MKWLLIISAAGAAMMAVAAGVFFLVPSTSFSPEALGYSVARESGGGPFDEPCDRHVEGGWSCDVWTDGHSSWITYRVEMEGSRCWHGRSRRQGYDADGEPLDREIEGCLKIRDQIRLFAL